MHQRGDRRRAGHVTKHGRPRREVDCERERAGFGDRVPLVGLLAQESFNLGLAAVDLFGDGSQRAVVDDAIDDEPTLAVELRSVGFADPNERRLRALPGERRVPRVRHRLPHELRE